MKKSLKLILCLALVMSTLLCFAACGGDDKDGTPSLSGKYTLCALEMDGARVEGAKLVERVTAMGYSMDAMYVEFYGNGKGYMSIAENQSEMCYEDGKIWPIDEPDNKVDYTVSGNKVTVSTPEYSMTFSK